MAFEWICETYNVPSCKGRRVIVDGKHGTIVKDLGNSIGVRFDGEKNVLRCHPTWEIVYGEMEKKGGGK